MAKPAVFLDHGDALISEAGDRPQTVDLKLIPGVAVAVRSLNNQGLFCCLVAKQSGPARNNDDTDHIEAHQSRLCSLLRQEADAHLDALYYCPYLRETTGETNPGFTQWGTWGRPNTGMLVAAAWDHDLDLRRSFMVTDNPRAIAWGRNAGLRGVLVQAGDHPQAGPKNAPKKTTEAILPDHIAPNLSAAVAWILTQFS